MVTAIACSGPTGCLQHAGIAERRHIALLLQLEAALVDAARSIDRQHQLQVDPVLGERRRAREGRGQQEPARDARGDGRKIVHSHVIASEQPCGTAGFAPNLGQNESHNTP